MKNETDRINRAKDAIRKMYGFTLIELLVIMAATPVVVAPLVAWLK